VCVSYKNAALECNVSTDKAVTLMRVEYIFIS